MRSSTSRTLPSVAYPPRGKLNVFCDRLSGSAPGLPIKDPRTRTHACPENKGYLLYY